MPVSAVRANFLDGETNVGVVDFSSVSYTDIYNEGGIAVLPDVPFGELPDLSGGLTDYWNTPPPATSNLLIQYNNLLNQFSSIIPIIIANMGGGGLSLNSGMASLLGIPLSWSNQPDAILKQQTMPVLAGKIKVATIATLVTNPVNNLLVSTMSNTDVSKLVNLMFGTAVIVMGIGNKITTTPSTGVKTWSDTNDVSVLISRTLSSLQGSGFAIGSPGATTPTIISPYGAVVTDFNNVSYKQIGSNTWVRINLVSGVTIGSETYTTSYVFYNVHYTYVKTLAARVLEIVSTLITNRSALIKYSWSVVVPDSETTEVGMTEAIPVDAVVKAGNIKITASAFDSISIATPVGFPTLDNTHKLDVITLIIAGFAKSISEVYGSWLVILPMSVQSVISQTFTGQTVQVFLTMDNHPPHLTQLAGSLTAVSYWTTTFPDYYLDVVDRALAIMSTEFGPKTLNSVVGTFACPTKYLYRNQPNGAISGSSDALLTPLPAGTKEVTLSASISFDYIDKLLYKCSTNSGLPAANRNFLTALNILPSLNTPLDVFKARFERGDNVEVMDTDVSELIPGCICKYAYPGYLDTPSLINGSLVVSFVNS